MRTSEKRRMSWRGSRGIEEKIRTERRREEGKTRREMGEEEKERIEGLKQWKVRMQFLLQS